jgi:hypothetical protein
VLEVARVLALTFILAIKKTAMPFLNEILAATKMKKLIAISQMKMEKYF